MSKNTNFVSSSQLELKSFSPTLFVVFLSLSLSGCVNTLLLSCCDNDNASTGAGVSRSMLSMMGCESCWCCSYFPHRHCLCWLCCLCLWLVCQVAGLSICWCCSCFFFTDTVLVVIDFDVIVFVDDNTGVPSSRLSITVRCQLCSLPPPTTSTSALSYNTLIYIYIIT